MYLHMHVLESRCKRISYCEVRLQIVWEMGLKRDLQDIPLKEECCGCPKTMGCLLHVTQARLFRVMISSTLICILSTNEVPEISSSFFYSIIIPLYFLQFQRAWVFSCTLPKHYRVSQNASSPETSVLPLFSGYNKTTHVFALLFSMAVVFKIAPPSHFAFPLCCPRT